MPSANIMLLPVNLVTVVVISIYHLIYLLEQQVKKKQALKQKRLGVVKRDHPDWCLKGPTEITKEEYNELKAKLVNDPYWNKKTRQNTALFADRLIDEPNYTNRRGIKTNTVTFKKPTTAEIKMFHQKKRKIRDKEIQEFYDEANDYES